MRTAIVALLLMAALVGGWWLIRGKESGGPPGPVPESAEPPAAPAPDAPLPAPAAESPAEPAFRERLRTFVTSAAALSADERARQAEALRNETLAREAEGALLPAESAYIQLALLRAALTDEAQWRRQSEALLARYRSASEQGWEEYRRRTEPRHQAYREAEAELIRRARAEGVSDEALRERLQALREAHYP